MLKYKPGPDLVFPTVNPLTMQPSLPSGGTHTVWISLSLRRKVIHVCLPIPIICSLPPFSLPLPLRSPPIMARLAYPHDTLLPYPTLEFHAPYASPPKCTSPKCYVTQLSDVFPSLPFPFVFFLYLQR